MRCRQKRPKAGEFYPVKHCHSYPLPAGLAEGTIVKLIHFSCGYWTVEANGRQFHQVFLSSVESGWQYELNGRWFDADNPRLKEPI